MLCNLVDKMNSQQRLFQFSGFLKHAESNFIDILKTKVKALNGIYFDDDSYHFNCTHLVCFKFVRTEKVLCALAAGKFVVSSDYIYDSYRNGKWLKETDYEWPNKFQDEEWLKLNADSLAQNCKVARQANKGLFHDWKVAVILKDNNKNLVFKRILLSGGADIVDLKVPLSSSNGILSSVTHIFCEKDDLKDFSSAQSICLHTDFIMNYIFRKNSAKAEEFLTSKYDPNLNFLNSHHNQCSKRKSSTSDITNLVRKKQRGQQNKEKINQGGTNSTNSLQNNKVTSGPLDRFLVKKDINLNSEKLTTSNNCMNKATVHLTAHQVSVTLDELLEQILFKSGEEINEKISTEELSPTYTINCFSMNMIDVISCIRSLVSATKYPPANIVSLLLWNCIWTEENEIVLNEANQLLHCIISLHPPSLEMQDYYQSILCYEISGHCYLNNSNWKNIFRVLKFHEEKDFKGTDRHLQKNRQLTMLAILRILEFNLLLVRKRNGTPLIVRLTWPNGVGIYINGTVLDLISAIVNLISLKEKDENFSIVGLSVHLLSLLASCCQFYCPNTMLLSCPVTLKVSSAVLEFSKWLASRIHNSGFDYKTLNLIFSLLPPWINVLVLNFKLNLPSSKFSFDQMLSLISEDEELLEESKIPPKHEQTMHEVNLTSGLRGTPLSRGVNLNKRNCRGETVLHLACIKGDHEKVAKLLSCPGIDVNVRDYAGWTPIHEAANHGFIECVKKLLSFKPNNIDKYLTGTPTKSNSVDLKALGPNDFTPLHDAIANNHVEVAMLILHQGGQKLLEMKTAAGVTAQDLAVRPEIKRAVEEFVNKQTINSKSPEINSRVTETKFHKLIMKSDDYKAQFILIYHCIIAFYSFTSLLSSLKEDIEKMPKLQSGVFNTDILKKLHHFKRRMYLDKKESEVFNTLWTLFKSVII